MKIVFSLISFVCVNVYVFIYWSEERVMKKSVDSQKRKTGRPSQKKWFVRTQYRVCEIIVSSSYTTDWNRERTDWKCT